MKNYRARFIGKVAGRKVHRIPVLVRCNDSQLCATVAEHRFEVIAHSASEAANWVADMITRPETEVTAWGPQGGRVDRFIGWDTGIWKWIKSSRDPYQMTLKY